MFDHKDHYKHYSCIQQRFFTETEEFFSIVKNYSFIEDFYSLFLYEIITFLIYKNYSYITKLNSLVQRMFLYQQI